MDRGFESLIAWQRARALSRLIYEITRAEAISRDYRLVSQMRAASVSIMSNIAEGYERGNRAEFHQALVIAKGECGELRSQLYVALDNNYVSAEVFEESSELCREPSRILERFRSEVATQRDNGRHVGRANGR